MSLGEQKKEELSDETILQQPNIVFEALLMWQQISHWL
jgi:hypothetical protein